MDLPDMVPEPAIMRPPLISHPVILLQNRASYHTSRQPFHVFGLAQDPSKGEKAVEPLEASKVARLGNIVWFHHYSLRTTKLICLIELTVNFPCTLASAYSVKLPAFCTCVQNSPSLVLNLFPLLLQLVQWTLKPIFHGESW
ncbi:BAHD family acyltransferase, clade V [Corchorus olitorius]|uniref:BAHD family acyltransferase, clade V n=1 Tax=Corchorus olitorius TaxID=93759 RepID=A0A1R3I3D9_9ROSI|nr:BAHD family acyltransferase, clade V [Corchorus olitorius]